MGTTKPKKALARSVFDDGVLVNCRNGAAARGNLIAVLADSITARIHEGRPFFHFWGGQAAAASQPASTAIRTLRLNTLEGGCKSPRGVIQFLFEAGAGSPDAGIYATDGTLNKIPGSKFTQNYPDDLQSYPISQDTALDTSVPTGETDPLTLGSDSIILTSGVLFEETVTAARPDDGVSREGWSPGADILATKTGSFATDARLIDRFEHAWNNRRPQGGWSAIEGTFCDFTESSQEFRYWGDQTIGEGGTDPDIDGPGDTIVAAYAGAGLRDTIRCYVSVYAAMSGTTDQGTLAIANRGTDGTVGPMVQIGSSGMISGTSFQWYPATGSAFDPSSAPYFESPTVLPFDHVLLGAKSNGATDTVRIGAWMMFLYHSVA